MKTICIAIGGGQQIPRYFLRRGLIEELAVRDVRVVLLVLEEQVTDYKKEFSQEHIRVVGLSGIDPSRWYEILISFSRAAFHQKLSKAWHWIVEFNASGVPLWRVYINRTTAFVLGTVPVIARVVQAVTRFFVSRLSSPESVVRFFDEYKPDVVFVTSATHTPFDVPVLIEARRRGIKTVGTVRGWDALSNIGFLLVRPDTLLAQTQYVKDMAVRYNFFPQDRVTVIGFPHFDWYHDTNLRMSREEFLHTLGVDASKRVILFGAVSGIYHEREVAFAEMFDALVKRGALPSDLVLIFRMHPYYQKSLDRLDRLRAVVPDRVRAKELPGPGRPEADLKDIRHQINSFYHSELLITPSGTIVLDMIAFGKPVIALAFDGRTYFPYRYSLRRAHDGTCFDWAQVGECRGMQQVFSEEEFISAINQYLQNPSQDEAGRACIRKRFIEPFDGHASERLIAAIISVLE